MNNLNNEGELKQVVSIGAPVLLEFWSSSCSSCVEAEKFLLKLEQIYNKKCSFIKISIDQATQLIDQYSISKLPTFILFNNSVEQVRIVGFKNKEKEIEKTIRNL
jgi:thioredoxin 1